ncbi:hypothetical protein DBR12_00190 [Acidovorax sp. HMWF029]|uniref:hypothetical protein n=1 Tax=Acidovorax sp. HMWF029 TaxID=2056863 RepID=UPI000D3852CF|nr:hypothetical protein [Acidovorax sp. HMWF029]PTT24028.1 hypothetical protein DBR12_00190 [Acidovorax sp. HMWF029]
MPHVFVNENRIGDGLICTRWDGWDNKASVSPDFSRYRIEWLQSEVLEGFGRYWRTFVESEQKNDGDARPPHGIYAELAAAKYPSLHEMLSTHGGLFARLIAQVLQTEFIGYLVPEEPRVSDEAPWFLYSMTEVEATRDTVVVQGRCFSLKA